jgi:hypothetical protein
MQEGSNRVEGFSRVKRVGMVQILARGTKLMTVLA